MYRLFVRSGKKEGGFLGSKAGRELGRADCRKSGLNNQMADVYPKELCHNEHMTSTGKGTRSPIAVFLQSLGYSIPFHLNRNFN